LGSNIPPTSTAQLTALLQAAVTQADNAVKPIDAETSPSPSISDNATSAVKNTGREFGKLLESLLGNTETFIKIMDEISEIHPYAKGVWSILTVVHKVIKNQKEVDKDVVDLTRYMDDMYDLVIAAEPLKKLRENEDQKKVLEKMAQQTLECANFIYSYASSNRLRRTFMSLGPQKKKKIDEYKSTFDRLRSAFDSQTAVRTQLTVTRILEIEEEWKDDLDLNDMAYAAVW